MSTLLRVYGGGEIIKEIVLLKYGEIILKGLNRPTFEQILVKNIKIMAGELISDVRRAQATIYVTPAPGADINALCGILTKVFGVAAVIRAGCAEKDIERICEGAAAYIDLSGKGSFKVEAKRADKSFPIKSPEICRVVGEYLLKRFGNLRVDVQRPEIVVNVEIRDREAYVYGERMRGPGGLPVGTGGRAMLLLSGGIDSPVAGYMIAKRGVNLEAVHFFSPPFTGERAREKVLELARVLKRYTMAMRVHMVSFTEQQLAIRDNCPEEYLTLIMRRMMMLVARELAARSGAQALITGESIGQVASQTLSALQVTDCVAGMPVFRPLIGMDKQEIVTTARAIETYETSILPYEDCCTVFVPKHPATRPTLEKILRAEQALDMDMWVRRAVEEGYTEII